MRRNKILWDEINIAEKIELNRKWREMKKNNTIILYWGVTIFPVHPLYLN